MCVVPCSTADVNETSTGVTSSHDINVIKVAIYIYSYMPDDHLHDSCMLLHAFCFVEEF